MTQDTLGLLSAVIHAAGYRLGGREDRPGILAENAARVVWATTYPSVSALLEGWQDEQGWLVELSRDRLSVDKAWELYLVLGCEPEPDAAEVHALQAIHQDTGYARKLVVPGLSTLSPARLQDYLAPLEELPLEPPSPPPDALGLLEDAARREGRQDALTVLAAYRHNQPLFDEF